jgi:AcrR family transcriptional regulator
MEVLEGLARESGGPRRRKESQAETRARLIAVGREHFLRYGLGGAVAERIATEAGYTRGALYANFSNKEELFVAVLQASAESRKLEFRAILEVPGGVEDRLRAMREAIGNLVTNPDWMLLQAEFQANALRFPAIREAYLEQQARRRLDGAALLREFAGQLGLELSGTPEEVVEVIGSLTEGLAARQAVLGRDDPEAAVHAERSRQLAMLCFDRLVWAGGR